MHYEYKLLRMHGKKLVSPDIFYKENVKITIATCIFNVAQMFVENFMIFYFLTPLTPYGD